jgi:hypothetical protein
VFGVAKSVSFGGFGRVFLKNKRYPSVGDGVDLLQVAQRLSVMLVGTGKRN